jgi:tetratricopeptide (TPR) repeat protein
VLAEMRVALELDNASAAAYQQKGEALLRKGDAIAAIEALERAKQLAPTDPSVAALLAEAEIARDRSVRGGDGVRYGEVADSMTKNYPTHHGDQRAGEPGSYTRPTSLQKPDTLGRPGRDPGMEFDDDPSTKGETRERPIAPRPRSSSRLPPPKRRDETPTPPVRTVGGRPGTVEVDLEVDGVEVDDDFGEVADPPPSVEVLGAARTKRPRPSAPADDDDDVIELDSGVSLIETPAPIDREEIDRHESDRRASASRRSVGRASGPLEEAPLPARVAKLDAADRPTAIGDLLPVSLRPPPMFPGPDAAVAAANPARGQGAAMPGAAMPTMIGAAVPPAVPPRPNPAAAAPTMALSAAQQRSAAAVETLFPDDKAARGAAMPAWAKATIVAPGGGPVRGGLPGVPPRAAEPVGGADGDFTGLVVQPAESGVLPVEGTGSARHHPNRARSPRRIALWIALGILVIGGGVFAGFQIRGIRLERQIDAATRAAEESARPDTWLGWVRARDGFAGIVAARDTAPAREKVARARAVLAADLGDDLAGAQRAVEALGPGGGTDAALARAYIAIATGDPAAARVAAQAALAKAPDDAAAHAVVGRAEVLGHRWAEALPSLKAAVDKDLRPAHLVALAQAELGRRGLEEARGACERSLALVNDHPATLILRAQVLAASGKLATGALGAEVAGQLERVIAEGQRTFANQVVGVSPRQAVDAMLALVVVELARNDAQAARVALDRATAKRPSDQQFAEGVIRALLALGQYTQASAEAEAVLEKWPGSRTARVGLAETQLVEDASAALQTLVRAGSLDGDPAALTLRGKTHLALGDLAAARTDLAAALAIAPSLEAAIIAKTWAELAAGEAAVALSQIEPLFGARGEDPLVATAYAAALRQTGSRDKARDVLVRITAGPETPDVTAAWLELGRLERDGGDYEAARKAYGKAISGRGIDAKREAAMLYIDAADAVGGRAMLEDLLKQAPSDARILIETARARTLLGDLTGARDLIARAEKLGTARRADLAREKGRLALKAGAFRDAIGSFEEAIRLDDRDLDAHLLLLDAISTQEQPKQAIDLLEPAKKRFGDRSERFLIMGKVALITKKFDEARSHFENARKQLEDKKAPPRRIAEALIGLGQCADASGDVGLAVRNFEDGLRKDPTQVDAWAALGDIAASEGDPARALQKFQRAAEYNPEYAELAFQVGRHALALGRKPLARGSLERYLVLAPNGEYAVEAKKMLARTR